MFLIHQIRFKQNNSIFIQMEFRFPNYFMKLSTTNLIHNLDMVKDMYIFEQKKIKCDSSLLIDHFVCIGVEVRLYELSRVKCQKHMPFGDMNDPIFLSIYSLQINFLDKFCINEAFYFHPHKIVYNMAMGVLKLNVIFERFYLILLDYERFRAQEIIL